MSIPANEAMGYYFSDTVRRARGRPITTLPITLHNDLKRLQRKEIKLTTEKDLQMLRDKAKNRREWITFITEIRRTAEAARPDDLASERP